MAGSAADGRARHPLPFSDQAPDRADLEARQLELLDETLARAAAGSPFYRERLAGTRVERLGDLAALPFTYPRDLAGGGLLAVPAQHVERMVSLPTSGTLGPGKRIAFTAADLERTRSFFAEGLHCIARAGEKTAVLFPCSTPNGLGTLICDALGRIGAEPVGLGLVDSLPQAARAIGEAGATSLVGGAQPILALARWCALGGIDLPVERVLLSSDNVCGSIVGALRDAWRCEVFEHYGMTETGFGGAVDCHAHAGMHVRELDLLVEIVDPATGEALPDGVEGEVTVTTLTAEAMPLVRYRTGDLACIVPGPCPCGGTFRRLSRVQGHVLGGDGRPCAGRQIARALDEALFSLPPVIDYAATLRPSGPDAPGSLSLAVTALSPIDDAAVEKALQAQGITLPASIKTTTVEDISSPLTGKPLRLK